MLNSTQLLKGPCVYIITSNSLKNYYKLGSSTNIIQRLKSYHTHTPGQVYVEHVQYFYDKKAMILAEKLLHYSLDKNREYSNKEWFKIDSLSIPVEKLNKISVFINNC